MVFLLWRLTDMLKTDGSWKKDVERIAQEVR